MNKLIFKDKAFNVSNADIVRVSENKPFCNHTFRIALKQNYENKTYYFKLPTEINNVGAFPFGIENNEVFAPFLLKKILGSKYNSDILEYDYAILNGKKGSISESFLLDNEIAVDVHLLFAVHYYNKEYNTNYTVLDCAEKEEEIRDFFEEIFDKESSFTHSIEELISILKSETSKLNYKCDINKIDFLLKKMIISDYFINNYDRNMSNICLVINPIKKEIKLAPNFDNGLSLGTTRKGRPACWNMRVSISEDACNNFFYGNGLLEEQGILPIEIYELTRKDERYKEIVDNFINIDLQEVFDDFYEEKGINFSEDQKILISNTLKHQLKTYQIKKNRLMKIMDKDVKMEFN